MNDFICGTVGGMFGTILSHPFDTARIMVQTKTPIQISNLYKGLLPPLFGIGLEKSLVFGTFYTLDKYKLTRDWSIFTKGMIAGFMSTLVVSPVEHIKIQIQTNKYNSLNSYFRSGDLFRNGIGGFYRGWKATLFREVPGYGLYFLCYENVKKENDNLFRTFLNGSLSGMFAWAFIYPTDYVKTTVQNENTGYKNIIRKIWRENGIKGFYRGANLALLRCIPLHGGVFVGYEIMKELINS